METSAQRKLTRGVEQVKRLRAEADDFENRDAYVFRVEIESRTAKSVTYRVIASERESASDEWPLLAGEAIQNLRSALDHVVYAAAGGTNLRTQFPIVTDLSEFPGQGDRRMRGVPGSIRAVIESAQPYRTAPQNPAKAPLAQLRELSNLDKHRILATVANAVDREGVGYDHGVSITRAQHVTNQRLGSGDTHVSTFTATSESELTEIEVEPYFSYQVEIEGRPLAKAFVGIVHAVCRVLYECENGEPLSPFAPYPL